MVPYGAAGVRRRDIQPGRIGWYRGHMPLRRGALHDVAVGYGRQWAVRFGWIGGGPVTDALGDRMKFYEARESDRRFLPMVPVYARIDGRNFSAFTRWMKRPYDTGMTEAMIRTAGDLVEETHARIGYTQSDEISLVWLSERSDQSIFFDHRIAKMTSVLAALATAAFTANLFEIEGMRQ
jgi:hypothetical protein